MTKTQIIKWADKELFISEEAGVKGTIITIHGLTGSHKNMIHYSNHLKGDYRVISVDLRGRGNSSAADVTSSIFKHAQDILTLIQELNIDEPILLGHSMGAFISSIVASQLPSTKAVILLDGAALMSEHQRDIVQPSLGRLSKKYETQEQYVKEIRAIYNKLGVVWSKDIQAAVEYEVGLVGEKWENKSDQASIRADFDSFYTFSPKDICSQIQCPVLFVYAKSSNGVLPPLFRLSDYDETLARTPNIRQFISDCNHYTMVFEKRDDILHVIDDFLKDLL